MLFSAFFLALPAGILASRLPIIPRRDVNQDDCTTTSTLPPITLTSLSPTSTLGSLSTGVSGGGGSLIYTTALPTLGSDGPGMHTYTVTVTCPGTPGSPCSRLSPSECPPGFTTSAVACSVCGPGVVTTVLTLPLESAVSAAVTAGQPSDTTVKGGAEHVIGTEVAHGRPTSASASPDQSSPNDSASGSHSVQTLDSEYSKSAAPASTNLGDSSASAPAGGSGDSSGQTISSVRNTFSTQSSSTAQTTEATPSTVQVGGSGAVLVDVRILYGAFSLSFVLAQLWYLN